MNRFRAMMIDWLKATFAQGAQDGTIANVSHPEREANALLPLLEGALLAARVARDTTRFDDALGCVRSRMPGLT
ncbi:hypothetical protein ACS3SW_17060 [Roseobacteraceae bacterium S113]